MRRSWVSHCIIPCPGIDRCEFYKPGEASHPLQHTVSKIVNEDGNSSSTSSSVMSNNKKLVQSGTFLDNLAPIPFNPKVDPPNLKTCFNCWRTNHQLKDCYSRKKNKFCSNCGRKYVVVENCPRCAKAYYEYIEEEEHLQAKIELYGDTENSNFNEKNEEVEFKPVPNTNCSQNMNDRKKDDSWTGGSFNNISRKGITTSRETAELVSSCKDSKSEYEYKNNNTNISPNFVKEFKSMNLNGNQKSESFSTHYMDLDHMEPNNREKNYKEYTESNESCTSFSINSSKWKNNQTVCKDFTKSEDEFPEANSEESMLDDSNEDLEDVIFEEEVEENPAGVTEDNLESYRNLLSRIKNLPIEAQNVAIRLFINSQKRHQNQA